MPARMELCERARNGGAAPSETRDWPRQTTAIRGHAASTCLHCRQPLRAHAGVGKCLFDVTEYEHFGMKRATELYNEALRAYRKIAGSRDPYYGDCKEISPPPV